MKSQTLNWFYVLLLIGHSGKIVSGDWAGSGQSKLTSFIADPVWNHLGPGINGWVNEIVVHGIDVYVGGSFIDAGGDPDADYIARWDGCQWHAIGPGLDGEVRAIAIIGNDIYVGGNFGQPFNYISRWDGEQWHSLGSGPGDQVNSIVFDDGILTAGGGYWNTGFVKQWNGSTWTSLGPSLNGRVNDMMTNAGTLYAGGRFTDVGGNANADGIMKWEDGAWQNLGSGIYADIFIGVWNILEYNNEIFAGGIFMSAGGNTDAHFVVMWDGEKWENTGEGLQGFLGIHALAIYNGSLLTTEGAGWASNDGIYSWDFETETWSTFQIMELGPDDPMLVLTAEGSNLYVAGYGGMFMDDNYFAGISHYGAPFYPGIVTSTEDNGPGSLRQKIVCASDGDTITFTLSPPSQIILTSGEIVIDKNLTLSGPGITDLIISGNHVSRIFNLYPGYDLQVEDLTLSNAYSLTNGGAVFTKGNLTLKNTLLQHNFESGIVKALTLTDTGRLTVEGNVQLKQ